MVEDEIFTLKEMESYLNLAENTVYRLASEGKLPGFKVGWSWRFRKSEVGCWIRAKETVQEIPLNRITERSV